jgi:betaine-aldehyde dehydrogenase
LPRGRGGADGGSCDGGNDDIVHNDADLAAAVDAATFGIFFNAGQVCNAGSRLYLHESIADAFLERFSKRARALRVGPPDQLRT